MSLDTVGTQSVTVNDTANATITAAMRASRSVRADTSEFIVSGYPATTAGTSHSFTVTVTDAYGNLVTGYRGTVNFSSSDTKAGLPLLHVHCRRQRRPHLLRDAEDCGQPVADQ